MELGAISVSIEDAQAGEPDENPVFGEPGSPEFALWQDNRVVALFNSDVVVADVINTLSTCLNRPISDYLVGNVGDQDWVRATQAEFEPIPVADCLWIVPSWHQAPTQDRIALQVDPGLAFGTGSHPTTHLCLEWLCSNKPLGQTVFDYGCGSGILAIAAAKLGATQVEGVDIDPQAVETARDNAIKNNVGVTFYLPHADPARQYDVVLANILTNPLIALAPLLAARCKIGGTLVLSGILQSQATLIIESYQAWFDFHHPIQSQDWIRLVGRRRP